mmetsp:Transcript_11309/g.36032  ORF Transcript_11309/g.36032 Transcript_11309/m.36032 type:complete len:154 (-) Transcript_11309:34-495(-)
MGVWQKWRRPAPAERLKHQLYAAPRPSRRRDRAPSNGPRIAEIRRDRAERPSAPVPRVRGHHDATFPRLPRRRDHRRGRPEAPVRIFRRRGPRDDGKAPASRPGATPRPPSALLFARRRSLVVSPCRDGDEAPAARVRRTDARNPWCGRYMTD